MESTLSGTDESLVYVRDIESKEEREATEDDLKDVMIKIIEASQYMQDLDEENLAVLKEVQRLITQAHWSINSALRPLNEISKGRKR